MAPAGKVMQASLESVPLAASQVYVQQALLDVIAGQTVWQCHTKWHQASLAVLPL